MDGELHEYFISIRSFIIYLLIISEIYLNYDIF